MNAEVPVVLMLAAIYCQLVARWAESEWAVTLAFVGGLLLACASGAVMVFA